MKKLIRVGLAALVIGTGVGLVAPSASAKTVDLTPRQLTQAGFPRGEANTAAWGKGTVELPGRHAPALEPQHITGKAPKFVKPGQVLTMERFIPTDRQGSGSFEAMEITTTVKADRSFDLQFALGRVGRFGYRVGYLTDGKNPEFVGFQFQFRTTAS